MFIQSLIYSSRNDPDTPNAGAMAYKGNVRAVALFNSQWQITVKQIWQSVTVHQLSSRNTKCSCMNRSLITIWDTAASNLQYSPRKVHRTAREYSIHKKSRMRNSYGSWLHRKVLLQCLQMQCQESPTALKDLQPGCQAVSSKKSVSINNRMDQKRIPLLCRCKLCWFIWKQVNISDIFKNSRQFKDSLFLPQLFFLHTLTHIATSAQTFTNN